MLLRLFTTMLLLCGLLRSHEHSKVACAYIARRRRTFSTTGGSETYYPVEYAMIGTGSVATSYNDTYSNSLTIDTLKGLSETIGECFVTSETPTYLDGRTTVTYSGTEFDPNQYLEEVVKLGNQKITWKWDFCQTGTGDAECEDGDSACDFCKADTILGLLQGNDNTPLNGAVVVKSGDNYITPTAASGTESANNGDYNLESYFELDITVTQTD